MVTNQFTDVESKEHICCVWITRVLEENKGNINNKPIVLEENLLEPKKNLGF